MNAIDKVRGLSWKSGVAELEGSNLRFALNDLSCLEIRPNNPFRVGERLEAVDPRHQSTICVASIADVRGPRLRIHFDGYANLYDFWVHKTSPLIFSCGFCEQTKRPLSVPPDEGNYFNWNNYLRRCNAVAAPKTSFAPMKAAPGKYKIGDSVTIREKSGGGTAESTVLDIIGDQVLLRREGLGDDTLDEWYPEDSQLIRLSRNRSGSENSDIISSSNESDDVGTCQENEEPHNFGMGHIVEAVDPFNPKLIRRAHVVQVKPQSIQLRFVGWEHTLNDFWVDPDSERIHPIGWCLENIHPLEPATTRKVACTSDICRCELRVMKKSFPVVRNSTRTCPYSRQAIGREIPRRFESKEWPNSSVNMNSAKAYIRSALHRSILKKNKNIGLINSAALKAEQLKLIEEWDCLQVAAQVTSLTGDENVGKLFLKNQIDGTALICLKQEDLTRGLKIKLGPSLKILSIVN